MKTILSMRRHQYLAVVSTLLVTVTLIAGMVGCGNGGGGIQYDLTITSTEGGEVTTPEEGTHTYDEGEEVNLIATAEEYYHFVKWTGDVDAVDDANAAETTVTMNDNYSITASFVPDDVEQVWDWYDLDVIRDNPSGSYVLIDNLDSTTAGYEELASPTANGGKGWQPLGVESDRFNGSFDGQGFEIRDLFIDRPDEGVGLFFYVGIGGMVEDVGIVDVVVTGNSNVGGLIGLNRGTVNSCYSTGSVTGNWSVGGLIGSNSAAVGGEGTVSNSFFQGSATGNWHVGGLVGVNEWDGTVNNCHSIGSVTSLNYYAGGLVGSNQLATVSNSYSAADVTGVNAAGGLIGPNNGIVRNCFSTGSVTGEWKVGGLAAWNNGNSGNISNCYSTGTVIGNDYVGGLFGSIHEGSVSNSYSIGSVNGVDYVGGLTGRNYDGTVSNSYSVGGVSGVDRVGGLVGNSINGTVNNSFWDTETSGQATSDSGIGKTTAEMQDISTFSGATWDIVAVANPSIRNNSYIWNIVDDITYPFLSWES